MHNCKSTHVLLSCTKYIYIHVHARIPQVLVTICTPNQTHKFSLLPLHTHLYIYVHIHLPFQYLSTPESLHQIPELIRFICCVIHPTNEVLASDVIPRWALIGWLLSLCQSNPVVFTNAKLALFYDWLAYNPESDNIMNIGTYYGNVHMYMCRVKNYYPPLMVNLYSIHKHHLLI